MIDLPASGRQFTFAIHTQPRLIPMQSVLDRLFYRAERKAVEICDRGGWVGLQKRGELWRRGAVL